MEDITAKYVRLFDEYNELFDTYELCDNNWDKDILDWLEPAIELKLKEIFELESRLVKKGLLVLPVERRMK